MSRNRALKSCGTGRPGGVQRTPCPNPRKMSGICPLGVLPLETDRAKASVVSGGASPLAQDRAITQLWWWFAERRTSMHFAERRGSTQKWKLNHAEREADCQASRVIRWNSRLTTIAAERRTAPCVVQGCDNNRQEAKDSSMRSAEL